MTHEILIVDDEEDIRSLVQGILEDEGYATREAGGAEDAYKQIETKVPDLVILDIWLQGSAEDGLKILENIKQDHPSLPVVMISGHGTIETAVTAIKHGAYDFIEKPFKADRLLLMIQRAIENARLRRENETLRQRSLESTDEIIGESPIIQNIRHVLKKAAPTNSRILLIGEAGTGKNMAARYIHRHSTRAKEPFMVLNCTTMHPERLEVELFGSIDGVLGEPARAGLIEIANGGTLLLDEVGDLPIETQGKLVRFLQDETCRRIGDTGSYSSDIRLIASTSRNLEQEKNANRFRSDLYYRLNVVPVPMPALRDRTEDIPLLVEKIIQNLARTHGYIPRQFSSAAMMLLQAYEWPGNIRQLRNILEWVMIMKGPGAPTDQEIQIDDLPPEITGQGNNTGASGIDSGYARFLGLPLREAREKFEREYLQAQVERFHGNVSKTAQFVEMERSALHRKLKTLEIYANDRDNSAASTQEEENPPARTAISG